jgi:hypothetical protein
VTAVTPVGLAFDGFDGYVSVPPEAIVPVPRAEAGERHVREIARVAALARPLVSLASVLDAIRNRTVREGLKKER